MIRFGMCGSGGFVERAVLPMMLRTENASPTAIFDVDEARREAVCAKFGLERSCASLEELLAAPIDVVYIASPNALHREQAVAAAQAGKHVFCQKPLAITGADCRAMLSACRDNGVKLGVGFCYRFGGAQQKVKELLDQGALGRVSYMHFGFHLMGMNRQTAGWRCDPHLAGGGPLMDLAPHMIDLAYFFLKQEPQSVMAYVEPDKSDQEVEMDVHALVEFRDGAVLCLDTSFDRRSGAHNYTLVGEKGHMHAVGTMPWLTNAEQPGQLTITATEQQGNLSFSTREHIEEEMRAFCSAVEAGEEPPVPGSAGFRAQAVVDAIYESGRTGRRCPVASLEEA